MMDKMENDRKWMEHDGTELMEHVRTLMEHDGTTNVMKEN